MSDRTVTLAEFMTSKVGLFKATKVAAFVYAWGVYSDKTPEPHTLDGYTKYWGQSLSTTYKERDLFRLCWPDDKVPDRIWSVIAGRVDTIKEGRRKDVEVARLLVLWGPW
jgi:hypothetical protein